MPGLSMIDRQRKAGILKAAEPKRHIKKLFATDDDRRKTTDERRQTTDDRLQATDDDR